MVHIGWSLCGKFSPCGCSLHILAHIPHIKLIRDSKVAVGVGVTGCLSVLAL